MSRRFLAALLALALNGSDYSTSDAVADDASGDDDADRPLVAPPAFPRAAAQAPSLLLVSSQRDVGLISLATTEHDAGRLDAALVTALSRCRERGDLKVQVVLGTCDQERVRRTCERHGFMFSKCRRSPDGRSVAEFYTDLYYRPSRAVRDGLTIPDA